MPAKKKTKKKSVAKKTIKKVMKKQTATKKKPTTKKATKKTVKKKTVTAKGTGKAKKKASTKKKTISKKAKATTRKVAKKKVSAQPKKAVKAKAPTKEKAAQKKTSSKKPKTNKNSMTKVKNNTKITPPLLETKSPAPLPAIKEDKKVDTTMEELDFAPYAINKGEDYMTDEQLEHFRKILLRWKHQLMEEVDSTVGHMKKEEGLSFPDPVDRASQEEGFNLELRARDRERKLIKKIESALDSIETGDYGYCEDCGAEIGVRRLEARPTATKCIDCKTYQEIRERQAGG